MCKNETIVKNLYQKLKQQRDMSKDLIADTRSIEAINYNGKILLEVDAKKDYGVFGLTKLGADQIAAYLQVPRNYFRRLIIQHPNLAVDTLNTFLQNQEPERRMLRITDGKVRAFLSDRYKRMDSLELMDKLEPMLMGTKGLEIVSANVTMENLYLQCVNRSAKQEVVPGDTVIDGFCIINNECGQGFLRAEHYIMRLVCKNGLMLKHTDNVFKKMHKGKQIDSLDGESASIFDQDNTHLERFSEIITQGIDKAYFYDAVEKMRIANERNISADISDVIERMGDYYNLNSLERSQILRNLILDNKSNFTLWNLVNAVTKTATHETMDPDRKVELQLIGGQILKDGANFSAKTNLLLPQVAA